MNMSKYMKNFILCGDAESHCLLCNETFYSVADIDKHLRWEQHRKTTKDQTYIHRYKKDAIYEISSYYYCEHCNIVIYNIDDIKTHIESQTHISHKTNLQNVPERIETKKEADNIIINNKIISKWQWQGIINNMCIFCDLPVQNVSNHIKDQDHVIRLVQSEVKCTNDNNLYRQVSKENVQCFTCNKLFSISTIDKHWETHNSPKEKVPNGKSNSSPEKIVPKIRVLIHDKNVSDEIYKKEYKLEDLNVTEDLYFDINVNKNKITCKKCKIPLVCTYNALTNHLFSHNNYKSRTSNILNAIQQEIEKKYVFILPDHGKNRSEAATYGKQNYIKMNAGGSKGYCTLCDKFLSANINVFKSHVEGCFHLGHLEIRGLTKPRKHAKKSYKSEVLLRFLKNIMYSTQMECFWINIEFVAEKFNFMMLKQIHHGPHYKKTKCFCCDETFLWGQEKEHCMTRKHKMNFFNAKVVNMDQELIRETQPRCYHCAYCNETLPFFETLEKHVETLNHRIQRVEKSIVRALTVFVDCNGFKPNSTGIVIKNVDNDTLYKQLIDVMFEK